MRREPTNEETRRKDVRKSIAQDKAKKPTNVQPLPQRPPVAPPVPAEFKRYQRLAEQLQKVDTNAMTPISALMKLQELQRLLPE